MCPVLPEVLLFQGLCTPPQPRPSEGCCRFPLGKFLPSLSPSFSQRAPHKHNFLNELLKSKPWREEPLLERRKRGEKYQEKNINWYLT